MRFRFRAVFGGAYFYLIRSRMQILVYFQFTLGPFVTSGYYSHGCRHFPIIIRHCNTATGVRILSAVITEMQSMGASGTIGNLVAFVCHVQRLGEYHFC